MHIKYYMRHINNGLQELLLYNFHYLPNKIKIAEVTKYFYTIITILCCSSLIFIDLESVSF